jgi:Mg2+ and Co2+ transporter CorA
MGQRINIQYSIDIDDLPDEVSRLLQNTTQELDKLSNSNITEPLSLSGLESISELRKGLANVDAVLQDVSAIINGYVSYRALESSPQLQPTIEEPEQKNEEPAEIEYSF